MKQALLVYWGILSGTGKDVRIVTGLLQESGYEVQQLPTQRREDRFERIRHFMRQVPRLFLPYKIQVHLEQIHREQFRLGRWNLVFINPEWTDASVFRKMKHAPWILCKTRHALQLCDGLGPTVRYLGFTSEDQWDPAVEKDYRLFLHVAGQSDYKGTRVLHSVWSHHPEWPKLHILYSNVNHYGEEREPLPPLSNVEVHGKWIADEDFRKLSNRCGVHLCPSEMEGFGHTLMEGMSTGAILVTTDGPPMNELVRPDRGVLVEAKETGRNFMSPRFSVKEEALEAAVGSLLQKSEEERRRLGQASRQYFLTNDAAFRQRFRDFLAELDG